MHPILFHLPEGLPLLGGAVITSFGLMMLLAFLTAAFLERSELARVGLDPDHAWDLLFVAVVGGFVGAHLYYVILHWDWTLEDPAGMILARGGMVWYGGLLGAGLLVLWKVRRSGLPLPTVADLTAPAVSLAYAVGQVGCFLVGDDYGRPTDSWVGIRFPHGNPPTTPEALYQAFGVRVDPALIRKYGDVVPVHPTELYEVALSTLIFLILWKLRRHDRSPGWLFMVWLVLAGTERLLVEFVRVKDDRFFGPLSLAQVISMALILVGVVGVVRLGARTEAGEPEPEHLLAA